MSETIGQMLEGLYLVYAQKDRLEGEPMRKFLQQYAAAIEGATPGEVRRACQIWQFERKASKFPLPHELKTIIDGLRPTNRGPKGDPWRELSPEEYRQLGLRDKARYLRILASELRAAAGPMPLKAPKGFGSWDMPAEWQQAQSLAAEHEAEARKLEDMATQYKAASQPETVRPARPTLGDFIKRMERVG